MTAILSLNAGSSSIKFAIFSFDELGGVEPLFRGKIEKIGIKPTMSVDCAKSGVLPPIRWTSGAELTHEQILADFAQWLSAGPMGCATLAGIGHRVVHGGNEFVAPRLIEPKLVSQLELLSALAPIHQPHNLSAIRAMAKLAPQVPQVACFDTAFHHDRAAVTTRFALPRHFHDEGVRRYGFHGISYEFIARELEQIAPELAAGRVIVAHLGSGASLCGMRDGKSVDTTMGLTALDGLVMGTRCGSIDPGALLYLQLHLGMTAVELQDLLYQDSGLLGVSAVSNDMRVLEASNASAAAEAIDLFVWRAVREIGALTAVLEGIDAIIFTAGIGENDASVRRRICERLRWLGIELDDDSNQTNATYISTAASGVAVLVIPTDEELMIARHTCALLSRLRVEADDESSREPGPARQRCDDADHPRVAELRQRASSCYPRETVSPR